MSGSTQRMLLGCPDRPGLVAEIAGLLGDHGANIVRLDEHADGSMFAARVEWTLPDAGAGSRLSDELRGRFGGEGRDLRIDDGAREPRVAILCSTEDHCLADLLWRFARGEMPGRIARVISTCDDHRRSVDSFDVPFDHLPVESREGMPAHEEELLGLLTGEVELVVLARYMRILSAGFLERLGCPAINIHHSFLPAFKGAGPYERAHERGVKLIGATAHYVTAELDEGPIIEQDTVRVSHRDTSEDLRRKGRDVERVVLARAVRAQLEDRVVTWDSRTVVFP